MMRAYKYKINKKTAAAGLSICFFAAGLLAPNVAVAESPEQIQRAQEILQEDKMLREKTEEGAKSWIERITVKGASHLDEEQITQAILPYQKRWLTRNDIGMLLGALEKLCVSAGHEKSSFSLQPEIKGSTLEVSIKGGC